MVEQPRHRTVWYCAIAGAVLTLLIAMLLDFRLLPTGVPGQWQWPWREILLPFPSFLLAIPLIYALAVYLVLRALRQERPSCGWIALSLIVCCLSIATTQTLLVMNEPLPALHLARATGSATATGYFSYATAVTDLRAVFRAYSGQPAQAAPMPARVRTHPPGPLLAYYWGLRSLEAMPALTDQVERYVFRCYGVTTDQLYAYSRFYLMPTVWADQLPAAVLLGLLVTLLGALLPLPAYFIGRELGDGRTGLLAGLLVSLLPSLLSFVPSIEGVAAGLILTALALWMVALRRGNWWLFALAGLAVAAAAFWTIGTLALAVVMATTAASAWLRDRQALCGHLTGAAIAAGTFIGVFFIMYACGYSLPGNLKIMMEAQRAEMLANHRQYLTWLSWNLYDALLFVGPALLALIACGISRTGRWYGWGALAALALVWLSGSTLGEVGRIWLFLFAAAAVIPAVSLISLSRRQLTGLVCLVVLLQLVLVLALHLNLGLVQA